MLSLKNNITYDYNYIHSNKLSELSPELQSRKLQQLFLYNFSKLLLQRRLSKQEPPSDNEVVKLMSDVYARHKSKLNFIQVGACDGDWKNSNDPIQRLLLTSLHWHGVMMEPVPYLFEKLKKAIHKSIPNHQQRLYLLNAALSNADSIQTFYIINEQFRKELPNETHAAKYQQGSFIKQPIISVMERNIKRGKLSLKVDDYINTIDVQSMTPVTVMKKFMNLSGVAARDGMIDILVIDTEGYDLVILQAFMNKSNIRPTIIIYENMHINKVVAVELLNSYGYITIKAGWNTYGVRVAEL